MLAFLDLFFGNGNLFAGRVGQHDHFCFFPAPEARNDISIFENHERRAEGRIDTPVWIQDILTQALQASIAHSVELRTNHSPNSIKLMAGTAVLSKYLLSFGRRNLA